MQHLLTRHGRQEWISDGEPSDEAVDAAILVALASRLGLDWQEADDALEGAATDDDERANARWQVNGMGDDRLLHMVGLLITERRQQLQRADAKRATFRFIAGLFVQVPA